MRKIRVSASEVIARVRPTVCQGLGTGDVPIKVPALKSGQHASREAAWAPGALSTAQGRVGEGASVRNTERRVCPCPECLRVVGSAYTGVRPGGWGRTCKGQLGNLLEVVSLEEKWGEQRQRIPEAAADGARQVRGKTEVLPESSLTTGEARQGRGEVTALGTDFPGTELPSSMHLLYFHPQYRKLQNSSRCWLRECCLEEVGPGGGVGGLAACQGPAFAGLHLMQGE